ncbi:MAG: hypothetical protein IJA84_06830 [Clostridia bacterium]|nr:hypothetical protein [Clostridia bacterium]
MAIQAWRNECRTTTVCVDSYSNGVLRGRFHNPYCEQWIAFESLTQLLIKMEQIMDEMAFPRSFTETRTFSPMNPSPGQTTVDRAKAGKKATFAVRVLFRQNSSWQGSVTWLEARKEESFRSVLELILLMDNALTCETAE